VRQQPTARTLLATGVAGVLAFLAPAAVPVSAASSAMLAGALCGAVVGLFIGRRSTLWLAAATVAVATLVATAVANVFGGAGLGPVEGGLALLSAVVVTIGCAWLSGRSLDRIAVLMCLALVLVACALMLGLTPAALAERSASGTFSAQASATDADVTGAMYLHVSTLMREGVPYTEALDRAAGAAGLSDPGSARGSRPSAILFLWRLLPTDDPVAVWWLYVALTVWVVLVGWALAARYVHPGPALLSAIGLSSWFAHLGQSRWFATPTVWAAAIVIAALYALSRRRWLVSALLLVLAVTVDSLAFVVLPAWFVAWLLYPARTHERISLGFAAVGSTLVIGLHALTLAAGGVPPTSRSIVELGSAGLISVLRFGTESTSEMWLIAPFIPLVALAATIAITTRWRRYALFAALGSAAAATLALQLLPSLAVWGALLVMPMSFAVAPVVFGFGFPSRYAIRDARACRHQPPETIRVVLPAYNEEASICDLIVRAGEVLEGAGLRYTITVVNDGSSDRTGELARSMAPRYPVTVLDNPVNLNLGGTIARGLRETVAVASDDDVIVTLDADLTQDPVYIPSMLVAYDNGADVVIASRFMHGSKVHGLSAFRHFMTFGARAVFSTLLYVEGVKDYSCGFRVYSVATLREAFDRLGDGFIEERGFACMAEILAKLRHIAVFDEVPFELGYDLKRGASAMRVGTTVRAYFKMIARIRRQELTGRL